MNTLFYKDLGRMDFLSALSLQEKLVEVKQKDKTPDILLFVEHPHVFTLGRGGKEAHVLYAGDVPIYRTSRGGDITYHGPGQLVMYPLIDLKSKLRRDVHRYLRNLEMAGIQTVGDFGLRAKRMPPWTGLWIEKRKIASIGIAVRRGTTYHGLALNVNTDLSYFDRIIPCGLTWANVTSMAKELGCKQSMHEVRTRFLKHFAEQFGYSDIKAEPEDISMPPYRISLNLSPTT